MSLRDIILGKSPAQSVVRTEFARPDKVPADVQLKYVTSGDDGWTKFDVFVHSVPEGHIGRATAEGLRKGCSDHCEGWTCRPKRNSRTSPFSALKDL